MPEIGEIRKAKEIGRSDYSRYIWNACPMCGKERWVIIIKGQPKTDVCQPCGHKRNQMTAHNYEINAQISIVEAG